MPRRHRVLPRKLPKQHRARDTVDTILAATAHTLVRHGYEGASTNRIAERAGVSIGSVYQYYPSKDALVAAVQERHVRGMLATTERELERLAARPLREAAREMVRAMIAAHAVEPALHRVLMEQTPRVGRDRAATLEHRFEELVLTYLQQHRDAIRPKNLSLAAFIVVQVTEALTHAAVLDRPDLLTSDAFVDEVAELLVRYIARDASPLSPRGTSSTAKVRRKGIVRSQI